MTRTDENMFAFLLYAVFLQPSFNRLTKDINTCVFMICCWCTYNISVTITCYLQENSLLEEADSTHFKRYIMYSYGRLLCYIIEDRKFSRCVCIQLSTLLNIESTTFGKWTTECEYGSMSMKPGLWPQTEWTATDLYSPPDWSYNLQSLLASVWLIWLTSREEGKEKCGEIALARDWKTCWAAARSTSHCGFPNPRAALESRLNWSCLTSARLRIGLLCATQRAPRALMLTSGDHQAALRSDQCIPSLTSTDIERSPQKDFYPTA